MQNVVTLHNRLAIQNGGLVANGRMLEKIQGTFSKIMSALDAQYFAVRRAAIGQNVAGCCNGSLPILFLSVLWILGPHIVDWRGPGRMVCHG